SPWWPSSTPGTSNGMAPSRSAVFFTSAGATNRKRGSRSMKREISHGQAIRSTRARSRVTHCITSSSYRLGSGWSLEADPSRNYSRVRPIAASRSVSEAHARATSGRERTLEGEGRRGDVLQTGPRAVEDRDLAGGQAPRDVPRHHVGELGAHVVPG